MSARADPHPIRDFFIADLIDYLGRDNSFPHGAILLTGTGIIPADDFTLQPGDLVQIAIDGLGLAPLENTVRRGA